MRKSVLAGALALACLSAGCTNSQVAAVNAALDKYDQALNNFNTIAARVNQSIGTTNATVQPYCSSAIKVGQNVGRIVNNNDKAVTALNALTAGLTDYCASPPADVGAAVVYLTHAIADAQAVVKGS